MSEKMETSATDTMKSDWVLLPREPTEEMMSALWSMAHSNSKESFTVCYHAMLAASPAPTVSGEPVAWRNPSGGINPLVLAYQKEDMRPERQAKYSEPLYTHPAPTKDAAATIERLTKELEEDREGPWPKWADELREYLMGFGVDPGDEWDLPEQYEMWMAGVIENETARALAAEARADSLAAELAQARQERDEWQMQAMSLQSQIAGDVERQSERSYWAGQKAELAKAREALTLPALQYLLNCVEAHAGKFPVPSHVLSMCAEIRVALSTTPEPQPTKES